MSDPLPAPSFNLQYTVPPMNIGEGYAAGISQMGQSIGGAITGLFGGVNPKTGEVQQGIFGQQQAADQTLAAMKQTGMMTQDQYDAVASKGLAAKQAMTGLFANQWIQQQAMQREMALAQGKTSLEIGAEHAKLLDAINAFKAGYPGSGGIQKLPYTGGTPQQRQQPPVQQQVVQQPQTSVNAANISNIQSTGGYQNVVPAGAKIVQGTDKSGNPVYLLQTPDGKTRIYNP